MIKRKKTKKVLAVTAGVLILLAAGTGIWFVKSPFYTLYQAYRSCETEGAKAMEQYVTSDKKVLVRLAAAMGSTRLVQYFLPDMEESMEELGKTYQFRPVSYERDGDGAYLKIQAEKRDSEDGAFSFTIVFRREDGKWLIDTVKDIRLAH